MIRITIRVQRNKISVESADANCWFEDFEMLQGLSLLWPYEDEAIVQALRDAHLGRERRLARLLQQQEMGGLVTKNGTLARDWHEQLRQWVKSAPARQENPFA